MDASTMCAKKSLTHHSVPDLFKFASPAEIQHWAQEGEFWRRFINKLNTPYLRLEQLGNQLSFYCAISCDSVMRPDYIVSRNNPEYALAAGAYDRILSVAIEREGCKVLNKPVLTSSMVTKVIKEISNDHESEEGDGRFFADVYFLPLVMELTGGVGPVEEDVSRLVQSAQIKLIGSLGDLFLLTICPLLKTVSLNYADEQGEFKCKSAFFDKYPKSLESILYYTAMGMTGELQILLSQHGLSVIEPPKYEYAEHAGKFQDKAFEGCTAVVIDPNGAELALSFDSDGKISKLPEPSVISRQYLQSFEKSLLNRDKAASAEILKKGLHADYKLSSLKFHSSAKSYDPVKKPRSITLEVLNRRAICDMNKTEACPLDANLALSESIIVQVKWSKNMTSVTAKRKDGGIVESDQISMLSYSLLSSRYRHLNRNYIAHLARMALNGQYTVKKIRIN